MKALEVVKRFIEQHHLLSSENRYLVAVSGGADSVCLLLMLQALGYDIEAVHCNFHLRGEESDRDESFVKSLCKERNITLHLTHFDTMTYATLHKVSIEMAARQLRYHYFEQLRRDIGADGICVAHHRDDATETVLMNLIRGTGIRGLQGIRPRNGFILRPLLCISRNDIEAWLSERQQTYVTDSTNLEADILRNHLRLNVIPLLTQMVPSASENILTTARRVGEAVNIYDAATTDALKRLRAASGAMTVDELLQEPSPESLLYEWLSPYGFNGPTIEDVAKRLTDTTSGRLWSTGTHELCLHRGQLLLAPRQQPRPTLHIPEPGTYVYDNETRFSIRQTDTFTVSRDPHTATLDAETICFPLTIRPTTEGDRFTPYGMKGTKLVSDYLTDRHLSVLDKRRQLVITDTSGRIVWLVGHRPDAHFCITNDTQQALIISHIDKKD